MDERLLVEQLKQGDETAFKTIVQTWQDMVYNTALGIVQNEDDADDITQEVFIQAYQSVTDFKGASKISTWLYRITLGKALDLEKKKKRKKRFGFVQALFGSSGEETVPAVEFDHPGVQLENKENAASLFKALKQLPDNQRIAFTLHKMEGRSYSEVAEIMDTTVTAVESLMARGRMNLKKILSTYYESKFKN